MNVATVVRLVFDILFSILELYFHKRLQCTFRNTTVVERLLSTRGRETVRDNERTLTNSLTKIRESNSYCLQIQWLILMQLLWSLVWIEI